METMEARIEALRLGSGLKKPVISGNAAQSKLVNYTDLNLTADTVNQALDSFEESTGISTVIVVETMEAVFGKTLPLSSILIVVASLALAVFAIVRIVKTLRNRKNGGSGGPDQGQNSNYGGYQNGGYQNGGYGTGRW